MPSLHSIPAGSYDIHIGEAAPEKLSELLRRNRYSSLFILADENTTQHCLARLVTLVPKLAEAEVIELESGEENKTIETCLQVWRVLGELGADRHSLLVNLGGGVVSDLGGFVASTFKRGISFVNVPTTLLAQVDASTGGKTGVDLDGLKNEVGVFADPLELYIFPPFLQTLNRREMMAGFAEALKHGLIADAEYWSFLCGINPADDSAWENIIRRSIEIKLQIVQQDPKEQDLRKALNFGHTVGHAVETFFLEGASVSLLHGEAVAVGMICEAYLSYASAGLAPEMLDQVTTYLLNHYAPVTLDPLADHRLLELMRHDKKNSKGEINFTLLETIGRAAVNKKCSAQQILEALRYYREKAALSVTN